MGRTIPPGGRTEIESDGCAAILVTTNERSTQRIWLRVYASKVLRAVRFSGPDLEKDGGYVKFKVPRTAESVTHTVKIERGDGGPLKPRVLALERTPVRNDVPRPSCGTANLREIRAGEEYELDITLRPPWADGSLFAHVRLETGVPEQPVVELRLWPNFGERLQWTFDGTPIPRQRSAPHTVRYTLAWSDEAPPGRIISVECDEPLIDTRVEEVDGEQVVVVTVPPAVPPPEGFFGYPVTLRTDDASVPELRWSLVFEEAPARRQRSPEMPEGER